MEKRLKKQKLLTYTIIILFSLFSSFTSISYGEEYSDNTTGNYVKNYHYDATVNKDGTVDVQETFDYYFLTPSHGMLRELPQKGYIYLDNEKLNADKFSKEIKTSLDDFNLKLPIMTTYKNLTVTGSSYEESSNFFNITLKIGNPEVEITGEKQYVIKYTLIPRITMPKEFDFTALSIIPENKRDPYENISFIVRLPKVEGFDSTKNINLRGNKDVTYQIEEKDDQIVVTGNLNLFACGNQNPFRLLALYPPGTFHLPTMNTYLYWMLAVTFIFMVICLNIWFFLGKDDPEIDVVEFMPPDNIDPLKMSMLYNETMPEMSVAIVYLASLNLISLKDVDGKNKESIIYVPKTYDDRQLKNEKQLPQYMKSILSACREEAGSSCQFSIKHASDHFWQRISFAEKCAKDILNGKITSSYTTASNIATLVLMIVLIPIMVWILWITTYPLVGLIAGLGIGCLNIFLNLQATKRNTGKLFASVAALIASLPMGMCVYFYFSSMLSAVIVGLCIGIGTFITGFVKKPTKDSNKLKGRISGFKKFITVAEKEKIKALYDADPNYCLLILPFAYTFGIGSKWIDKISAVIPKHITSQSFDCYDVFLRVGMFNYYYNSYNAQSDISDINDGNTFTGPSIGGGGFSGGGFGGGGSGSW